METLSKEEFTALAGYEAAICVSILIPSHRSGVEVNEMHDAITLKNKLQQAARTLIENGSDQGTTDNILKEGFNLVDQRDFWNNQLEGLAVYMSAGFFKYIKIPFNVKEELIISSSFYVTPLLPLMYNKRFYLLVLSRDDSTLYRGDSFGMDEVNVTGLPEGVNVEPDEAGGRKNTGSTKAGRQTYEEAIKAGESEGTAYLLEGFRDADQALLQEEAQSTEKAPLLLAGTDYHAENFRKISKYGNINPEILTGNFEQMDKPDLYHVAKQKLLSYFKDNTSHALKTFFDNSANELTSSIPEDVIPASYYSKVSDLFIQKDEHIWGKFDEATNKLDIHEQPLNGDTCLMNKAAVKTILNGGDVHVVEKEKMPAESKIAAFMRY